VHPSPSPPDIPDHKHDESRIYAELGARRDGSLEPFTAPAHHQESLEELTLFQCTLTHGVGDTTVRPREVGEPRDERDAGPRGGLRAVQDGEMREVAEERVTEVVPRKPREEARKV
jgi:hypothetical protein